VYRILRNLTKVVLKLATVITAVVLMCIKGYKCNVFMQVQLEHQVRKVSEAIPVHLEVLDSLAIRDHQETPVSRVQKDRRALRETLVSMDRPACLDLWVLAVSLVILACLDPRDLRVWRGYRVQLVALAALVCRVRRAFRETLGMLDHRDSQACRVILDSPDLKVTRARQASPDRSARQASVAR